MGYTVSRYSDIEFRLTDWAVAACTFVGLVRGDQIQQILQVLTCPHRRCGLVRHEPNGGGAPSPLAVPPF